jgi:hypothetical protein
LPVGFSELPGQFYASWLPGSWNAGRMGGVTHRNNPFKYLY